MLIKFLNQIFKISRNHQYFEVVMNYIVIIVLGALSEFSLLDLWTSALAQSSYLLWTDDRSGTGRDILSSSFHLSLSLPHTHSHTRILPLPSTSPVYPLHTPIIVRRAKNGNSCVRNGYRSWLNNMAAGGERRLSWWCMARGAAGSGGQGECQQINDHRDDEVMKEALWWRR